MVFSSPLFIWLFLPLVLTLYHLAPVRLKNPLLLIASLLFYAWGERVFVLLMLVSIAWNYLAGLGLNAVSTDQGRRWVLGLGVAVNLGLLGFFKYSNFLVDNINGLLAVGSQPLIPWQPVHLPIGISFFTFQAISYLVDSYRQPRLVERNPLNLGLYISLFPQLIAGPIVRFGSIRDLLHRRSVSQEDASYGVQRFVLGLGKKLLIANPLGAAADQIFALPADDLTMAMAWLGLLAYSAQIYFDFSGYSDMAVGLGRLFGLRFPENFNLPYIARSVREFWRRWHISLSTWFRDYLYLPLGGSHFGTARTYFNLCLVFVLCGLWHGASWTFLCWGLYHGAFLVLERMGLQKGLQRLPRWLQHVYLLLAVSLGWVLFRSESIAAAASYYQALFDPFSGFSLQALPLLLSHKLLLVIAAALLCASPLAERMRKGFVLAAGRDRYAALKYVLTVFLMLLCGMELAAGTHNPFIYFRF